MRYPVKYRSVYMHMHMYLDFIKKDDNIVNEKSIPKFYASYNSLKQTYTFLDKSFKLKYNLKEPVITGLLIYRL